MTQPNPVQQTNLPGIAIGDVSNTNPVPPPSPYPPLPPSVASGSVSGAPAVYNLGKDADANMAIGTAWPSLTPGVIGSGNTGQGNNVAIGQGAMAAETTPNSQVAIGYQALGAITNGKVNVAIGYRAMYQAQGMNNVAVGGNTLPVLQGITGNPFQGAFNVAVGDSAGQNMTTGYSNTFVGASAGQSFTAGQHNVAVGEAMENVNTTVNENVAVGGLALFGTQADNAVAVGYSALHSNTTGVEVVAVGSSALTNNTTGSYLAAVGYGALNWNTTGKYNTAVGAEALWGKNTGVTGGANSVLGYRAGYQLAMGSSNTILGYNAGNSDGTTVTTDSSSMTLIGEMAQATMSNVIVLGKAVATRPNLIFGGVGASAAFGGGVGVFAIANAATVPGSNPTGGGVLYVNAGALCWRGSSGTVTTIAPA